MMVSGPCDEGGQSSLPVKGRSIRVTAQGRPLEADYLRLGPVEYPSQPDAESLAHRAVLDTPKGDGMCADERRGAFTVPRRPSGTTRRVEGENALQCVVAAG